MLSRKKSTSMQQEVDGQKPRFKLSYFNLRGRGELPRLILAAANLSFEDKRVEFGQWPEFKSKTPHGYLPVLEFDGNTIDQSQTIVRYLSKVAGLHGNDIVEAAFIEQYLDLCYGLFLKVESGFKEEDETRKKKLLDELYTKHFPEFVTEMENQLSRKDSEGYLLYQRLTTADIALYAIVTMFKKNDLGVKYDDKILGAHYEMVGAKEGIRQYVERRPDTLG